MALPLNHVPDRIKTFIASWKQDAPDKSFSGMTLQQFEEATKGCTDERDKIRSLLVLLMSARVGRSIADAAAMKLMDQVVNSVKGTPEFGDDCALYQNLGYICKSDRKSGLTRKRLKEPAKEEPL